MNLASPWARMGALLIDWGIASALVFIGVFPTMLLTSGNAEESLPAAILVLAIAWMVIVGGVGVVYTFARDVVNGRSIGRRVLKIQVVQQESGQPVAWWRAVLRDLFLRVFILLVIEAVLLFVDKKRQRLGDRVMKTVVIRTGV